MGDHPVSSFCPPGNPNSHTRSGLPWISSHWKPFGFCESVPFSAIWITWRCLVKYDHAHPEPWALLQVGDFLMLTEPSQIYICFYFWGCWLRWGLEHVGLCIESKWSVHSRVLERKRRKRCNGRVGQGKVVSGKIPPFSVGLTKLICNRKILAGLECSSLFHGLNFSLCVCLLSPICFIMNVFLWYSETFIYICICIYSIIAKKKNKNKNEIAGGKQLWVRCGEFSRLKGKP